jgi:c-di-AMP phosphodiesterase-like protein
LKTKIRFFSSDFVCLTVALTVASAFAFLHSILLGAIAASISIIGAIGYLYVFTYRKVQWQRLVIKALFEQEELPTYLNTMAIPTVLTSVTGHIKWANLAFRSLAGFGALRNINKMITGISVPDKDKKILIGGKPYKKELSTVWLHNKEYLLHRLVDIENTVEAKKLYQSFLPVVCQFQIDNYDELAAKLAQSELSEVVAAVERRLSTLAESLSAHFQRTDRGRYVCVFERRFLSTLRTSKFSILDDVRQIKTTLSPTLSIAVGVGESPEQSGEYAGKAMDLALGRGGDQAVIKQGDRFVFYGGTVKTGFRRSKVKARMVSHALRNLMEQCSDVYVMGHEVPDLDCLGAALGICACARQIGKKAYIVMDNPNPSIEMLLDKIKNVDAYASSLVTGQDAAMRIGATSMLVVVDTQLAAFTISPGLLEMVDTVVVIDHHIRGTSTIEKNTLFYHDPYASSACELVTEVMQYFDDDLKPLPIDLEALLCGITLDTKGFTFNTGVRTFEAASYLRRQGADTTVTRLLVQDDLKTYTAKTDIVRNAEIIHNGFAVSACPEGIDKASLIAAQAADALLTIRGVKASFVLSHVDDNVLVSGRSVGEVNVQLILESLGGGGHATIAAVKMENVDMNTAIKRLKSAINNYVKEVK